MSRTREAKQQATPERTRRIGALVEIMRDCWDTPADCNEGELFAYAEILLDRIEAGEGDEELDRYLADVQAEKLGMPPSDAYRNIRARALALTAKGR